MKWLSPDLIDQNELSIRDNLIHEERDKKKRRIKFFHLKQFSTKKKFLKNEDLSDNNKILYFLFIFTCNSNSNQNQFHLIDI